MINPELDLHAEISRNGASDHPGQWLARWTVPSQLAYFEGHFPGFPVLPGVAVIDVTLELLRRALAPEGVRLKKIQNAKFTQPIHPGQELEILIQALGEGSWKAEWRRVLGNEPLLVAELTFGLLVN